MSLVLLQKFVGHSDPKTTSRYISVTEKALIDNVKDIDERLEAMNRSRDRKTRAKEQERCVVLGKRIASETPKQMLSPFTVHSLQTHEKHTKSSVRVKRTNYNV